MIGARTIALAAVSVMAICGGPGLAQDVGVTAATNPVTTGEPPGQGVRELRIGLNVVRDERIRTTAAGSTQVIFLDRTSLTIGPNSDITIDQYVYNPGGGGNLAVRIGNGVLRFIGGEISHSDQIRITTPTATLGIRGGMALVDARFGKTGVVHLYGSTTVTTPFGSITLSKPNSYVYTTGHGLSDPTSAPPDLLARLTALLESKHGQTGGAGPGLVTSGSLRNLVGNTGPSLTNRNSQGLTPEQLQFIESIRPQLESIPPPATVTATAETTGCDDDDDDCDHDHHHHHHHHHHHFGEHEGEGDEGYDRRDRYGRRDHDRYDHDRYDHDRYGRHDRDHFPRWRFGDARGPLHGDFGLHGLPHSPGPCVACGPGPLHLPHRP